jgi:hypothetical protein
MSSAIATRTRSARTRGTSQTRSVSRRRRVVPSQPIDAPPTVTTAVTVQPPPTAVKAVDVYIPPPIINVPLVATVATVPPPIDAQRVLQNVKPFADLHTATVVDGIKQKTALSTRVLQGLKAFVKKYPIASRVIDDATFSFQSSKDLTKHELCIEVLPSKVCDMLTVVLWLYLAYLKLTLMTVWRAAKNDIPLHTFAIAKQTWRDIQHDILQLLTYSIEVAQKANDVKTISLLVAVYKDLQKLSSQENAGMQLLSKYFQAFIAQRIKEQKSEAEINTETAGLLSRLWKSTRSFPDSIRNSVYSFVGTAVQHDSTFQTYLDTLPLQEESLLSSNEAKPVVKLIPISKTFIRSLTNEQLYRLAALEKKVRQYPDDPDYVKAYYGELESITNIQQKSFTLTETNIQEHLLLEVMTYVSKMMYQENPVFQINDPPSSDPKVWAESLNKRIQEVPSKIVQLLKSGCDYSNACQELVPEFRWDMLEKRLNSSFALNAEQLKHELHQSAYEQAQFYKNQLSVYGYASYTPLPALSVGVNPPSARETKQVNKTIYVGMSLQSIMIGLFFFVWAVGVLPLLKKKKTGKVLSTALVGALAFGVGAAAEQTSSWLL